MGSRKGHEAVVKLLLAREDVDADSKDMGGQTPQSWAAEKGPESVVKLLLAREDVDADSINKQGRMPLSFAFARQHGVVGESSHHQMEPEW